MSDQNQGPGNPEDREPAPFNFAGSGSPRAWEPMEGEATKQNQGKPWIAFKTFRDLGPHGTLKLAAAAYYGVGEEEVLDWQYTKIRGWSSKYDWFGRRQSYHDWLAMRDQSTIEEFRAKEATEFFERQMRLKEVLLTNAEKMADQAQKMADWPLSEQRQMREEIGEDGESVMVTYVFLPSGWSKGTAVAYQNAAASAVTGQWTTATPGEDDSGVDFDFSHMTEDEIETYIMLSEKLALKRKP